MALIDDLILAIEANMTAEVGVRLKDRLEQAENDARELKDAVILLAKKEEELTRLQVLELNKFIIEEDLEEIRIKKMTLTLHEKVHEAREEELKKRNSDIFLLAQIVFDNPKMKFKAGVHIPGSAEQFGTNVNIEGGDETIRG